jgi:ABC-type glycerol-3-phosphate transport system substrate-binding protein
MPDQPAEPADARADPASPARPAGPRRGRVARRTVLRLAGLGALGGISLASLLAGQRGMDGEDGRPRLGPIAPPTSAPGRARQAAPATPAGPTTILFAAWWWGDGRRAAAWRALVEEFHAAQGAVRVAELPIPAADYARTILSQTATATLQADALAFPDEIATRLVRGRHLDQLDETVERLGIRDRLDRAAQAPVTRDGRTYGLLASLQPTALVHNHHLYAGAGIAEPPTSPEAYLDVAARLTRRPERFGHVGPATLDDVPGFWADLTQWVLAFGGTWATARVPLADSGPVVRAVEAYKALHDRAMPHGAGEAEIRRLVGRGAAGQWLASVADLEAVPTDRPEVAASLVSAPPPWESRRSVARADYVGIAAGSKKKGAARAWWEFALTPERVGTLLERSGEVAPIYAGALPEGALAGQAWASGFVAARPVVLSTTIEGFEASVGEFRRIVLERVREVLTAGKAPAVAMREAQDGLEDLASRL